MFIHQKKLELSYPTTSPSRFGRTVFGRTAQRPMLQSRSKANGQLLVLGHQTWTWDVFFSCFLSQIIGKNK
jgi:hypothetical protein